MLRKSILSLILFCLSVTAVFAAGSKVVFVDTQTVFDKSKLGVKYQGILREYFESRKKILDLDADEIQKLREDYTKQAAVLKPEAKKDKEESINRKINDFEKKRSEFNAELAKKNDELSSEFNQELSVVLKEMAKKEKFSLILNKSISIMSKGETPSVLYGDEDLNLTDKVITELDKKSDVKK